jgi:sulfatase maturation enzyme AslB (radical SAM superfamily)
MHYTIIYRGPLSSCNYGCDYCPFAKLAETHAELAGDRFALKRFVDWASLQGESGHELSVQFTPWGEALIRTWYQQALVQLSGLSHVQQVAIQTNLSCKLDWTSACDHNRLGLWCTYHPGETELNRFLSQCRELDRREIRYSVGIVGLKEHLPAAQQLRESLRPEIYLWVNAYKSIGPYYSNADIDSFTAIDPLFPINNTRHPSRNRPCRCGEDVFSVDGEGVMRRCHFIKCPIGNIYEDDWEASLRPQLCTNDSCGCHIGYSHMPELGLYDLFQDGLLARIPENYFSSASRGRFTSAAIPPPPPSLVQVSINGR